MSSFSSFSSTHHISPTFPQSNTNFENSDIQISPIATSTTFQKYDITPRSDARICLTECIPYSYWKKIQQLGVILFPTSGPEVQLKLPNGWSVTTHRSSLFFQIKINIFDANGKLQVSIIKPYDISKQPVITFPSDTQNKPSPLCPCEKKIEMTQFSLDEDTIEESPIKARKQALLAWLQCTKTLDTLFEKVSQSTLDAQKALSTFSKTDPSR